MPQPDPATSRLARAAMHAALGDPLRLTIVDELATSDRSPKELGERLGIASNLLAHHLDVLEEVGLITRVVSAGDGRRKYVQLTRESLAGLHHVEAPTTTNMLFLCTHNSARSQLAAALWTARTGEPADSAGTHPAPRVHPGAVAAARRAGLRLDRVAPKPVAVIAPTTQVVTVCDRAHEELQPAPAWWHWSIPDPVAAGTNQAFDAVVAELDARIGALITHTPHHEGNSR
ncbi:MAG: helix-turn-helix domain-containing protein [Actinomycetota bacterium]|nr:helix-turn-helix domain-containing protein [Actinomycetota bacterium]